MYINICISYDVYIVCKEYKILGLMVYIFYIIEHKITLYKVIYFIQKSFNVSMEFYIFCLKCFLILTIYIFDSYI